MGFNEDEKETKPLPITESERNWIGQLRNHYLVSHGYHQSKVDKSLQEKLKKWDL